MVVMRREIQTRDHSDPCPTVDDMCEVITVVRWAFKYVLVKGYLNTYVSLITYLYYLKRNKPIYTVVYATKTNTGPTAALGVALL